MKPQLIENMRKISFDQKPEDKLDQNSNIDDESKLSGRSKIPLPKLKLRVDDLSDPYDKELQQVAAMSKFKDNMSLLALNTTEIFDLYSFIKTEAGHLSEQLDEVKSHNSYIENKTRSIDKKLEVISNLLRE